MAEPWRRATSDHGRVLVLVVSPGALANVGVGDRDDAVLKLADAANLGAGLVVLDLDGER